MWERTLQEPQLQELQSPPHEQDWQSLQGTVSIALSEYVVKKELYSL
jgi:hypothetical protein